MSMINPVTPEVVDTKPVPIKTPVVPVQRPKNRTRMAGYMAVGVVTLPLTILPLLVLAVMAVIAVRSDARVSPLALGHKAVSA